MSLKQNVDYIKEEINNDEKMLESLIRFEGWFKRYKIPLVIVTAFLVILGVGYSVNRYYQEQQKEKNSSEPLKELCDTEVETKHKPTITEYNKPKRKNVRKLTNTEEVMGEKTESRFKIYSKLLAYTGGLFFLILFILSSIISNLS